MTIAMRNDLKMDELIASMKSLLKISARMYMHITRATLERFGREGEMTVRYGLRAYGAWRGIEMRQAHHAMGLEINMKNLIGCWDNASTYIVKDKMAETGSFKPYDARHDVPYCPAAEAWKEADFHQWGHVYCDEFHQACASSYHPDGNVVIPINMMKGDDHCHFQWIMPPASQKLDLGEPTKLGQRLAEDYVANTDIEAAWRSLKRSNRLVGGRFYTAARVLVDRHGEAGVEVLRSGLCRWGAERGERLRKQHEEADIPITLANFVEKHDLPLQHVWQVRQQVMEPDHLVIDVLETPQDEAWMDLNGIDLGGLWYEAPYPAMAATYMPGAQAIWTKLKSRGDRVNRLELSAVV